MAACHSPRRSRGRSQPFKIRFIQGLSRNNVYTHVPEIDLVHNLGEHVSAGLREGPVQLAGGVEGVPGANEGSDITVIRSVSWIFFGYFFRRDIYLSFILLYYVRTLQEARETRPEARHKVNLLNIVASLFC